MDNQNARRIPLSIIAGVSAAILVAGGGGAWWIWHSSVSSPQATSPESNTSQSQSPQLAQPSQAQKVEVYWLDNVNNSIELVPSTISLDEDIESEQEILNEAFDRLLAGPSDSDYASSIPEETELREISVKADGVHVDLSEEFTFGGGSASMMGRVAQILYTATSLDPDTQVWLEVEGEPLEVLGGEGLLLDRPLTRQNFEKNFDL